MKFCQENRKAEVYERPGRCNDQNLQDQATGQHLFLAWITRPYAPAPKGLTVSYFESPPSMSTVAASVPIAPAHLLLII